VIGLLLRVSAEDHRARCAHDLTGLHPWGGTRAMVGTNPLAPGDAVDSAGVRATDAAAAVDGATRQPTLPTPSRFADAQQTTADVPERQTCLRPSADHAS
jgi:hypothetical protein